MTFSYDEVTARLHPAFTLPLSTLLTQRELQLMSYSIMGGLFAHVTEVRPNGILMLFKDEEVRAWGEERIACLRNHTPLPDGSHCDGCGRTDVKLKDWYGTDYCRKCRRKVAEENAAYLDLEKDLKHAIERHVSRWQRGGLIRDLIGYDGNTVKTLAHQICHKILKEELFGKRK